MRLLLFIVCFLVSISIAWFLAWFFGVDFVNAASMLALAQLASIQADRTVQRTDL